MYSREFQLVAICQKMSSENIQCTFYHNNMPFVKIIGSFKKRQKVNFDQFFEV
jgi:hypothetical protein